MADKFNEISEKYTDNSKLLDGYSKEIEEYFNKRSIKKSFFYEFIILYLKNTLILLRNPKNFVYKIIQFLFIGVLFSIIFMNVNYLLKISLSSISLLSLVEGLLLEFS